VRKPIGITVPHREVGYRESPTLTELMKLVAKLEARIEKLEQKEKK
jgi:hypothetical protein